MSGLDILAAIGGGGQGAARGIGEIQDYRLRERRQKLQEEIEEQLRTLREGTETRAQEAHVQAGEEHTAWKEDRSAAAERQSQIDEYIRKMRADPETSGLAESLYRANVFGVTPGEAKTRADIATDRKGDLDYERDVLELQKEYAAPTETPDQRYTREMDVQGLRNAGSLATRTATPGGQGPGQIPVSPPVQGPQRGMPGGDAFNDAEKLYGRLYGPAQEPETLEEQQMREDLGLPPRETPPTWEEFLQRMFPTETAGSDDQYAQEMMRIYSDPNSSPQDRQKAFEAMRAILEGNR